MILLSFFLLFVLGLGVVLGLLLGPWGSQHPRPGFFWPVLCLAPFFFGLLLVFLGGWTFRRYGRPMAEIMSAADAVAEGDFNVRVGETGPVEMRRLARSFNRMTGELRRAEQQRRNLSADVAHELRNPLHIIQGNLEGMLDGVYTPTPENLNAVLDETHHLGRLVEDLQTLSLAESGQLPLHRSETDAAALLKDVAASFAAPAAAAGVSLEVDLPAGGQPLNIPIDEGRMTQVLSNLVGNALRYTPSGGSIHLGADPIEGGLRLSVSDSGAGIPAEDLPFIFDRFWRGDRARQRQSGAGSGLGLAIARQLVEAHGGRISASSQEGQGTRFEIELPDQPG